MNIFHRIKHKSLFSFLFFTACSLFFLTLPSCKKDLNSILGDSIQPPDEFITAVFDDTTVCLNLVTYTIADAPAITSGRSSYALGSYNDETFGKLTANLITQLYDSDVSDTVGDIYDIDSIVLYFVYKDAYPFRDGYDLDPVTISIGELVDAVIVDSTSSDKKYYSDEDRPKHSGSVLSDYTFTPNIRDSVVSSTDSTAMVHQPILRIRLDENNNKGKQYARKLLEASRDATQVNDFLSRITGLYIETRPELLTNTGTVVNFDFNSDYGNPGIIVYYKKTFDDTTTVQKSYTLNFTGGMTYNNIQFDRSTASSDFANQIKSNGDTALGQKMLFLQSFYGSLVRVQMPDIREFSNVANGKRIVINQASLVVNAVPQEKFIPATSLGIGYFKSFDSIFTLPDHSVTIGGTYNETKSEYRLRLTGHIQKLLQDPTKENVPLTIFSSSRNSLPDITTIYGPDKANGDKRMRLEIVYSILP